MYLSTKTIKCILFTLNIVCAILGVTLIGFGVWLLKSITDVRIDLGEDLAATVIIVLGFVVVTCAVFGCVGICMQSRTMLTTFAIVLFLLFAIQITLMSISYSATNDELPAGLRRGFDDLWDKRDTTNSTLAAYEEWLQCCGKNSAQDYFLLDKVLPQSCCYERDCTNVLNLFVDGCESKFKAYVATKTRNFNKISWLAIIAEFSTLVLACALMDSIKCHRDRIRFYS